MYFIFIGGASAGGKSSIATELVTRLNILGIKATKLNMDDYFHERPDNIDNDTFRATTNLDVPTMLHLDTLNEHVTELNKGNSIVKSLLSFGTNKYYDFEEVSPADAIVIEGIFAQYFYQYFIDNDIPSILVNVTTESYLDVMNRRVDRDTKERNRTPEQVRALDRKTVGPGFFQYTASCAQGADIYIINKEYSDINERKRALAASVMEIIELLNELRKGATIVRRKKPDVRALVANSHLCAEATSPTINSERRFIGLFNGVFGATKGEYQAQISFN